MQPNRKSKTLCLSYKPPENELPFYESIFHHVDTTKNGNKIQVVDARKFLSLSSISDDNLDMILNMVTINNASTLTRQQFYAAIRLIQFRQNCESVKNLKLTVPDYVRLNPPYFKNIDSNRSIICNSRFKKNFDHCDNSNLDTVDQADQDSNRSSNVSSTDLILECNVLRKELDNLKEKLRISTKQLNELTKDNMILQEDAKIIEQMGEKDCEIKESFTRTSLDENSYGENFEGYLNLRVPRNRSYGSLVSDITMENDDDYSRNKGRSFFPYQTEDVMTSLFKTDQYNNILNMRYES